MTEQNPDTRNDDNLAQSEYEPNELLAKLKAQAETPQPAKLPLKLPRRAIRQYPVLFQPREMNERHVSDLVSAIKLSRRLEPVTVIQIGREPILIEGHHRMAAYKRAKVEDDIPVVYFTGSIDEAVLEAGKANSKAKLSMKNQDKQNYAWRLVLMGGFSKREIREAAGVSDGQIATMRRTLKALGDDAYSYRTWWQARTAAEDGKKLTWDAEEIEDRKEAQAKIYADRLSADFYNKLTNNPEIAARALALHFGDKLSDLYRCLDEHLPDAMDESECEEDDF